MADTMDEPATRVPDREAPAGSVEDAFLARSAVAGDAAALRKLIDRYDRLVRYTVFQRGADRCRRDPQWLDSIASETCAGFVRTLNRTPEQPPRSIAGLLVRIARNRVASELRRKGLPAVSSGAREYETQVADDQDDTEPAAMLMAVEDLTALRACIEAVAGEDQVLIPHLTAITDRRWTAVAADLGIAESTVRSRWARLLDRLRDCVREKTGSSFAPDGPGCD